MDFMEAVEMLEIHIKLVGAFVIIKVIVNGVRHIINDNLVIPVV